MMEGWNYDDNINGDDDVDALSKGMKHLAVSCCFYLFFLTKQL